MSVMDSPPGFEERPLMRVQKRQSLLVGILVGLTVGYFVVGQLRAYLETRNAGPRAITPRGDLAEDEKSSIELFANASPSVVYVQSVRLVERRRGLFSREVFEVPEGTGTGFIWDDLGHIVTNFHVVEPGLQRNAELKVILADRSSWDARVVGVEPDRDLAVLKIDAPGARLRPIPVGTSANLQVGQKVYAIGNPFGFDQTLTTGIVSATGRTITARNGRTIEGVIQTDAAINPGNSGGPLLDSAGRLIGVNTMIYSPSGASVGIGFAVPVDIVNEIVPQLIRHGRVVRPLLGIEIVDAGIARQLGVTRGVLVGAVSEGSGAEQAGLEGPYRLGDGSIVLGDVIVAIDDREIKDYNDLRQVLDSKRAGDVVTLTVVRNGRTRTAKVKLGSSVDGAGE